MRTVLSKSERNMKTMERTPNGYARQVLPENTVPGAELMEGAQTQLAMVYVPYQFFRRMYTPEDGLSRGTMFEELYKPLEEGGV